MMAVSRKWMKMDENGWLCLNYPKLGLICACYKLKDVDSLVPHRFFHDLSWVFMMIHFLDPRNGHWAFGRQWQPSHSSTCAPRSIPVWDTWQCNLKDRKALANLPAVRLSLVSASWQSFLSKNEAQMAANGQSSCSQNSVEQSISSLENDLL